jgi:Domain of unknown function (DUF4406)
VKTYLAGPMRFYPLSNFPEFAVGTARLRELGHDVYSPAEEDLKKGFDPVTGACDNGQPLNLRDVLAEDLDWICRHAEAVVVLPGWRHSSGALAEVHAAKALGIGVYELEEFITGGGEAEL